jgi:hypothetical protein
MILRECLLAILLGISGAIPLRGTAWPAKKNGAEFLLSVYRKPGVNVTATLDCRRDGGL